MAINIEIQVLSIEQMNHLKELGVDTSGASVANVYAIVRPRGDVEPGDGYMKLVIGEKSLDMRFNLQDILNLLPYTIKEKQYMGDTILEFTLEIKVNCNKDYRFSYVYAECSDFEELDNFSSENPLEAAYHTLCWCAEKGYLKRCKP